MPPLFAAIWYFNIACSIVDCNMLQNVLSYVVFPPRYISYTITVDQILNPNDKRLVDSNVEILQVVGK